MRGGSGIPITSNKLNHFGSWEDIKLGVEFVYNKYVKDKQTGEKRCRYYAYGCSMGASTLGLYMIRDSETANKLLDAAVLYGTPWDWNVGEDKFMNGYGGWP